MQFQKPLEKKLTFLPLGGVEDVTKNMYVYEYGDEALLVDCGIGFADETMLGVDLLLPDIDYLLKINKKIVGMLITHGHEDHLGALPFVIPQLLSKGQQFPIYATPLTAYIANEKLRAFDIDTVVKTVQFSDPNVDIGSFSCRFMRVTHSIPDTAHILIKTPVGNIYHGSDFKFDLTPYDGKVSDIESIKEAGEQGVMCMIADSLGSERKGHSSSEKDLEDTFMKIFSEAKSRVIITTFSSHVNRINQIIDATRKHDKKICFMGRSLQKIKSISKNIGYLHSLEGIEVSPDMLRDIPKERLVLIVAGSQGQETSALMRMTNGTHKDVVLEKGDTVVFSSDIIPGNEVVVYSMIDEMLKRGVRVLYKDVYEKLHVSGHGNKDDLRELVSYLKPKFMLPISGMYRQMVAFREVMVEEGYQKSDVILLENGQKISISNEKVQNETKIPIKNIFVDEVSGEEVEHFVLHDREKLGKDGMVLVIVQVQSDTGRIMEDPDVVARGFSVKETGIINKLVSKRITQTFGNMTHQKRGFFHIRKMIEGMVRKTIREKLRREPLVIGVVIEI